MISTMLSRHVSNTYEIQGAPTHLVTAPVCTAYAMSLLMSWSVLHENQGNVRFPDRIPAPLDSRPAGMQEIAHRSGNNNVACRTTSKPDVDGPLCDHQD